MVSVKSTNVKTFHCVYPNSKREREKVMYFSRVVFIVIICGTTALSGSWSLLRFCPILFYS